MSVMASYRNRSYYEKLTPSVSHARWFQVAMHKTGVMHYGL